MISHGDAVIVGLLSSVINQDICRMIDLITLIVTWFEQVSDDFPYSDLLQ